MKRSFFFLSLSLLLILGVIFGAYHFLLVNYWQAYGASTKPVELLIASGKSSKEIINALEKAGVIEHPLLFRLFAMQSGDLTRYQAGEYAFDLYLSPQDVSKILAQGKTIKRSITIPEGWLAEQVMDAIRSTPFLSGELTSPPSEGSILPETYFFIRGQKREDILRQMQQALKQALFRSGHIPMAFLRERSHLLLQLRKAILAPV